MIMAETIRIEIPIETIDETDPELSNVEKKLGKIGSTAEKAGESVKEAGKKVSKFDASAEKTQRSLAKWAKEKYQIFLEAKEKITPLLSMLGNGLRGVTGKTWQVSMKALDFVTSPVKGIINLLKNPIIQAGAVLGVSIGMKDTIDTYKDFEAAMSQVSAISGATGSDFDKLNAKAKEMGATTKFTATEAAEGFNYMAMAGWKTKDMLSGIDGILSLAAASGENLGTTSDIVTDALTAFGLKASDSGHFADVLAQASANANTNVSMLGESFKYVAPVAGAMKYSVEDVSLALGLMANSSVKGSMAGTALKTSLANMASPTDKMEAAMKRYNISLENGKGKMKTLKEVMDNLRKGLGGLSETEQTAAASTIFGKEAMAGMLSIINASEKDYKKLTKAVNNADGASKKMADTMLDNLEGSITLLQSALDGVKLSFGQRLSPYVRGIADWLTEMMPDVESALNDMMDFVDRKVSKLQAKFHEISATDDWKNADFFGKANIAWDEFIVEPFAEWWEGTGKAKIAEKAGDFGSALGTGLNVGIMTLLGFDVSDSLDEGANIGRSFAKGFADGFDFDAISSKFWDGLGNLVKNAGKLLPGGESADLSSLLSAVTLAKIAGPLIGAGSSTVSLGKTIGSGASSVGNMLMGSMLGSSATGLAGTKATLGMVGLKLGSTATTATGLATAGAASLAGGAVGAAGLIHGGMDLHTGFTTDDEEKAKAYKKAGAVEVGGTLAGAGAGAATGAAIGAIFGLGVGAAPGALIGAGVGAVGSWIAGNKIKEEYEEKVELAKQEIAKAEKVYAATGHSIKEVSFESKALTDAMNDSSVSAEQLGLMFREAVNDKLKSSFGDISLSLAEIKEIAGGIVFDKQLKSMDKFEETVRNSDASFQTLQSTMGSLDKANWEVGLGMKLKKADKEEYQNAVDAYVESAEQYVENKHYEATVAMKLFVDKSDDSYTDGLDGMYSKMQKKIREWDNKLDAKVKVAMKDGIIDVDEEREIARLQKKIANITNKVASAEEKASFSSMKVRYSGSDLNAESFASLQEEIQANVDKMSGNYDSALQVSLTNLQLQLDEGAIDQKGYDKMLQKISDGYNKQIQGLQDRAQDFQLDAIADAFSSQLDGILPEIEGTTAEKFKEAMNHALSVQPDAAQWAPEDITKWFGLKGLDSEVREAVSSMLKSTALSVPDSVAASLQENTQSQFQQLLDNAAMYDTFSTAGNTYGSSMTTGITAGIQQGGPLLRSAAETTVHNAFATPFSVAANINVTPNYNMASAFSLPSLSGGDTKIPLKKHASGGFASSKQLSWLAEEGWGEFIIPTNPSRRKRALELYEQAGHMLGVNGHADGGFAAGAFGSSVPSHKDRGNNGYSPMEWQQAQPEGWDSPADGEHGADQGFTFSPKDAGNASSTSIQIDVQVNPEFNISAPDGQNDEDVIQVLRRHMREIADELGGEIASRLEGVLSNMPLEEA